MPTERRPRVLAVDDSRSARLVLEQALVKDGYEPVPASCGREALDILAGEGAPSLAIVDWMLPDVDGPEICARLRREAGPRYTYVILLTARGEKEDVITGLEAGADDFLRKPFDAAELKSRLRVGERTVALQQSLAARVAELQAALDHVRRLQGILPICMFCKRIRDDADAWQSVEQYIQEHSEAQFSHSLCKECLAKHYPQAAP